jgi:hypothetical protein
MDLLDALSANQRADSVAELSLNSLFRRGYSALYDAIEALSASRDAVPPSEFPPGSPPQHRFPRAWIKAIAAVVPLPHHLDFGQITRSYEQYLNGFAPFEAVPDSAYRITWQFDVNGILAKLPSYSSNGHPAMSQLW